MDAGWIRSVRYAALAQQRITANTQDLIDCLLRSQFRSE